MGRTLALHSADYRTSTHIQEMSSVLSEGLSSVQSGGPSTPERGISPSSRPMHRQPNQLGRDLKRMREDRCTSDVVLTSPSWGSSAEGVHVHSFILMARCDKYWEARKEMVAKVREQCPIVIPLSGCFSVAALKLTVQYLYTGEVGERERCRESWCLWSHQPPQHRSNRAARA